MMLRPVPDFPGYYASDIGRIWSCNGGCGRWLAQSTDKVGRKSVTLCYGGRQYTRFVHRLVLEAFVGPRPKGMEACHDPDWNPANNRLENLRWDTRSANAKDKVRHGHCPLSGNSVPRLRGEQHPRAKLTQVQVSEIRRLRMSGVMPAELANRFGVSRTMIRYINNGTSWKGS